MAPSSGGGAGTEGGVSGEGPDLGEGSELGGRVLVNMKRGSPCPGDRRDGEGGATIPFCDEEDAARRELVEGLGHVPKAW